MKLVSHFIHTQLTGTNFLDDQRTRKLTEEEVLTALGTEFELYELEIEYISNLCTLIPQFPKVRIEHHDMELKAGEEVIIPLAFFPYLGTRTAADSRFGLDVEFWLIPIDKDAKREFPKIVPRSATKDSVDIPWRNQLQDPSKGSYFDTTEVREMIISDQKH